MYLDDGQQYKYCNGSFCVRRAVQNVLFIEFEPLCQKLWAFMSNLASLSMITHQIWTSHATDEHCKY